MIKQLLKIILLVLAIQTIALSQNERDTIRNVGFSVLLSSSQLDIIVPINLTNQFVIAPSVGYVFIADAGSDYRLGMICRFYISENLVKPFIGFRGGIIIGSRKNSSTMTDGIAGLLGGLEYFINRYISTGIEAQLNATFSGNNSDRFGSPGKTNLNTATAIYATFYF